MDIIKEAYEAVCNEANKPEKCFVSLYKRIPFYGGPEEGGWWGNDYTLIESQEFQSEEIAEKIKEQIEIKVKELNEEEKARFGNQCLRELEDAERRGIDPESLPEVDGEEEYIVAIEEISGSMEQTDSRHWE